MPKNVLKIKVT